MKGYVLLLIVIGLASLASVADWLLKIASGEPKPFTTKWFVLGFIVYSSAAFGWVYVMQHMKLASIGIAFAVTNVLLLSLIGLFFFSETLSWVEGLGMALGLISLLLLSRFAA